MQDVVDDTRNGATLFQTGSALVSERIEIFARLKAELKEYLRDNGYTNVG